MRQRRRAERGESTHSDHSPQGAVSRRILEYRQRQFLTAGFMLVVLLVMGLLAYGWYSSSFEPPRKTVGIVNGESVKLHELVSHTRLDAIADRGNLEPDNALNNLVRDRVIALGARTIALEIPDSEVTQKIAERFDPESTDGTKADNQVNENSSTIYEEFIDSLDITDSQYREWIRGRMYIEKLQTHFTTAVANSAEQVFVHWIITTSSVTSQAAMDRVDSGEAFSDVANEVTGITAISGEGGVVGWVPRGAIPELDSLLFNSETAKENLVGPLTTSFGSMVLKVTDGPSTQPLSEVMRTLVGSNQLQLWLDEQVRAADVQNVGLTIEDSKWVIDRII